ncbi:MAG: hypothetical protein J0L92_11170 [Deltaproteobacteria bacterium]|nr:hypothetical protein [Deltaproteobacteria bacterium]
MDPVVIGVVVGVVVVVAIAAFALRSRVPSLDEVAEVDANTCAACGSKDVTHPAEGVYLCVCGFRGGPGMGAYAWKLETERVAAMSESDRAALLARERADAVLKVTAARGDYDMAERAFRAGEAITPLGRGEAMRKTELYDQVRELLPSAERHVTDAIASVEKVRHIERGGGRMNDWYDRLKGSRESALTVTGMQATAALRAQLKEVGTVLTALERELG